MAKLKFSLNAGAAVRGQVKGAIKHYCWENDLECRVEEDKRLVTSTYYFTITGTDEQIVRAERDIGAWLDREMY